MKNKVRENLKTIVLFISLILFIFIVRFLLKDQLSDFDTFIYNVLSKFKSNEVTSIMKIITKLSNALTVIIVCVSILFIFHNKYSICLILNVLITSIFNLLLKNTFIRERPIDLNLIIETGYSFPSGHAMASISLYGYLMYLAFKKLNNKILKNIVCIVLGLIIILVGISRIYLGVHFASDVIGGFLIATSVLMLFINITNRYVKY